MSRDSSSSTLADPTRRFYTCKVNNITFDVDVRYTNLQWVGGGAYGAVCSADDSHPVRVVPPLRGSVSGGATV